MTQFLATMTANPNTADGAEGSNGAETTLNDLKKDMRKYGSAEALGSASRPIAARRIVDAAYDGLLKEGDAEMIYGEYQAGLVAVGKKNPLTGISDSEKVQVSKFRQFIKVGMLPGVDARDLMQRTSNYINDAKLAGAKIFAPFDALLNAAREQMKTPDVELTDDQIAACVNRPEKASKENIDKLIDLYKKTVKMNEAMPMPSIQAAVLDLKDAITEAGGVVPPMTKDEKEAAEFAAKAAKFGYVHAA